MMQNITTGKIVATPGVGKGEGGGGGGGGGGILLPVHNDK